MDTRRCAQQGGLNQEGHVFFPTSIYKTFFRLVHYISRQQGTNFESLIESAEIQTGNYTCFGMVYEFPSEPLASDSGCSS